ncbi:MAG: radical SAM protein [Elusimicrobia bacterium]|nr:radical SAM protein [Elusimicrobiota bacterium]
MDPLSWHARKAVRARTPLPGDAPAPERANTIEILLERLRQAGINGDFESRTLYTRRLPPGCRSCLAGRGTNLLVTGLCTRDCFFCFNHKPRVDETVVHGIPISDPSEAPEIVERFGLRSVGLSGGEPLLRPERVLAILRALKAMPRPPRVDLYTNGDRADDLTLLELRRAGLDAIRFDLAARGYDLEPVRRAHWIFEEVAVEIPVIPEHKKQLERMVLELDAMGVPFLNIHELFLCAENRDRVVSDGQVPLKVDSPHLLWRPTAESGVAALELLLFALAHTRSLSVYYCSCGTQEVIASRGLARQRTRPSGS